MGVPGPGLGPVEGPCTVKFHAWGGLGLGAPYSEI